ncbi:hypothetical protein BaRGS_00023729 [Batillaria attramentaria]|uniref:Uncharacterized protein n=1 Tax=Batillaria attramentaria TaxID=370345 RepID=A0ABD0KCZ6_9CAEN
MQLAENNHRPGPLCPQCAQTNAYNITDPPPLPPPPPQTHVPSLNLQYRHDSFIPLPPPPSLSQVSQQQLWVTIPESQSPSPTHKRLPPLPSTHTHPLHPLHPTSLKQRHRMKSKERVSASKLCHWFLALSRAHLA